MILIKLLVLFCIFESNTARIRKLGKSRSSLIKNLYTPNSESKNIQDCKQFKFFTQNVDHFGFNLADTYKQRYIINNKHWKGTGSPIFFYTGNEGDIQWFCENLGFVWEIAEQFGALVVFAEHRYYGDSMPYGNRSYEKDHFNYLTSEQALADYAYLIKNIKAGIHESEKSAVIAFGGSYGGMLSAWFRMKYPNIITGALAASAPILQFVAKCDSFFQVITDAFRKSDPLCPHIIYQSWAVITKMGETKKGLKDLTQIFRLCTPLKSSTDLKDYLNEIYGDIAMANYPYATNFLSPLPAWPVSAMCEKMVDNIDKNFQYNNDKFMNAIYEGVNVYSNFTGKLECNDINPDIPGIAMDSWEYQTCSEFVFPFCSTGETDMFEKSEWNNQTYDNDCQKQFNTKPKSEWPIYNYGGSLNDLKYHSNIIFSNGDLDPWMSGGVLETINEKLPAILIKNGAHHLDLRASNEADTYSVKEARLVEIKYIKQWIKEYQMNF